MTGVTPFPEELPADEPLAGPGEVIVSGESATALWIDGNSISAAAVQGFGDSFRLLAAKTVEASSLVERVLRLSHPIFMEAAAIDMQQGPAFREALEQVLGHFDWPRPIVGVFPAGLTALAREPASNGKAKGKRSLAAGLRQVLGPNPLLYPRLFEASEGAGGREFWAARLDDAALVGERLSSSMPGFDGLVSGRRALRQILRLCESEAHDLPITLVDAGKLWTHYASVFGGRVLMDQAIPVGLARDDQHYYTSLSPTLANVRKLSSAMGSILYPADATPSPLFDPRQSSPQIDSTRFALQVARYAARVECEILSVHPQTPALVFYLSGMASRVPGMRDYLEARSGIHFLRFDRRRIPGVDLAPGLNWSIAADHLIPIGAAMAYLNRAESPSGMLLRGRRPQPVSPEQVRAGDIEPGQLLVVDRPPF